MRCKGVIEELRPVIPEGEYEGMLVDIRELDCCYGARLLLDFALSGGGELDGHMVSGVADAELHEDTKLGHWVAAILGRVPEVGEEVTADDLLHRQCRLVLRHRTHGFGQVLAGIFHILPATVNPKPEDSGEAKDKR